VKLLLIPIYWIMGIGIIIWEGIMNYVKRR